MLVTYYEKSKIVVGVYEKMLHIETISQLAEALLHSKSYDECITECNNVIELSVGLDISVRQCMNAKSYKAIALNHLGKKEEAEVLYKKYLLYCWAVTGCIFTTNFFFEDGKKRWEDEFGYQLELSLPW